MKRFLLIAMLILLVLPSLNAYEYHKQSTDLAFAITSNNATACNLTTINAPGSLIIINQEGNRTSQTFNFSIGGDNYSEFGVYCHNLECSDGFTMITGDKCYEINYFGKELTSSQSTLYIGLLAILIFILLITLFGIKYLPSDNKKDDQGRILSINFIKYLRLPLSLFAYFLFTGIIFLSSNVAYAFLSEQLGAKILFAIFSILLSVSPIILILLVISFFVKFFNDKEIQRMLNRGIFPQGKI